MNVHDKGRKYHVDQKKTGENHRITGRDERLNDFIDLEIAYRMRA